MSWIRVRKYSSPEPFTANLTETVGPYHIGTIWDPNITLEVSANGGTTWHIAANNTPLSVSGDSGSLTNLAFRVNFTSTNSSGWLPALSDIALSVDSEGMSTSTSTPTSTPTPTLTSTPTPTPVQGGPPSVSLSGSPPSLTCSLSSYNPLRNVTLYTNFTGSWVPEQPVNVSKTSNFTTFQKTAPAAQGNYSWNCLAFDSKGMFAFAPANATLTVTPPQGMTLELTSRPSIVSGNVVSFTARIISNSTEPLVVVVPAISFPNQSRIANLTIVPSIIPLLPSKGSADFTVSFSYLAAGKVSISLLAAGVGQQSSKPASSNAVESELFVGAQFSLSLSQNKLELLPNGSSTLSVLAKNTAPFTREKVRLKLLDPACCTFTLSPNGVDMPTDSEANFTLAINPVSTARPETTYATGIVAYTDTEPDLASADLTVLILKDLVPETGAAREKALSAIRNSNDTIFFVDERIADAERQKLDVDRATTTLREARKLYNSALDLLETGDYDGAHLMATEASTKAQSALILVPSAITPSAGVSKETAEAALKTSEETILFVDKQVAEAEKQKLDTYQAASALATARGIIKQATAALESGDYARAAELAAQGTNMATSALKSIPKPGQQVPTDNKPAIAGMAVLLTGAVIYFKFVVNRKPPAAQYYAPVRPFRPPSDRFA